MNSSFRSKTSFFDIAAKLLQKLKKICPEYFYREYNVDSLVINKNTENDINNFLKKLRELAKSHGITLSSYLLDYGIPQSLNDWIFEQWDLKNDFKSLYELLRHLTREIDRQDLYHYTARFGSFSALNENTEQTGFYILPRFSSMNENLDDVIQKNTNETQNDKDLNYKTRNTFNGNTHYKWAEDRQYLKFNNIYFVEKNKLVTDSGRTFCIKNHVADSMDIQKTNLDTFVIAAAPITKESIVDKKPRTRKSSKNGPKQHYFIIKGLKDPELLHERIKAAFLASCKIHADILLFPEILGDKETTSNSFWESLYNIAEEKGLITPKYILTPTWWHDHINELYVYDDGGEQLFIQQKQFPFDYKAKRANYNVTEDLRDADSTIHILHIPRIGRIIIPICKDFLNLSYREMILKELRASLLLIPSYSSGSTQFQNAMLDSKQYGCYEVWLNSCSALDDKKHPKAIGAAICPFKRAADEAYLDFLFPQCQMNCGNKDEACLFSISIGMDEEKRFICQHAIWPTTNNKGDTSI